MTRALLIAAILTCTCVSYAQVEASTTPGQGVRILSADRTPFVGSLVFPAAPLHYVPVLTLTKTTTALGNARFVDGALGADMLPILIACHGGTAGCRVVHCGDEYCATGNTTTTLTTNANATAVLKVAPNGLPVIAWTTSGGFSPIDVFLSRCDNTLCTSFTTETVETSTLARTYTGFPSTSLAIPADGNPVVTAFNSDDRIYAYKCDDPACSSRTRTVMSGSTNQGAFLPSAEISPTSGLPVFTYAVAGGVHFSRCTTQACTAFTTNIVAADTFPTNFPGRRGISLDFGSDGTAVVMQAPSGTENTNIYLHFCTDDTCSSNVPRTICTSCAAVDTERRMTMAVGSDTLPLVVHVNAGAETNVTARKCQTADCTDVVANTIATLTAIITYPNIMTAPSGLPIVMLSTNSQGRFIACADPTCALESGIVLGN